MFSKATLDAYAKQLDFFKIELGILQPDNKIIYAYNLAKPKPDSRVVSNPALNEKRYYLTWRTGEMQQADRDLLAKAGVEVGDRLILKFLPKEVELELMGLEKAFNNLTPKEIKKNALRRHPRRRRIQVLRIGASRQTLNDSPMQETPAKSRKAFGPAGEQLRVSRCRSRSQPAAGSFANGRNRGGLAIRGLADWQGKALRRRLQFPHTASTSQERVARTEVIGRPRAERNHLMPLPMNQGLGRTTRRRTFRRK